MPTQEVVTATPRQGRFNKNAARRVRVQGKIPAVVYGAKEAAVAIEVDPKQIQRILIQTRAQLHLRFGVHRIRPAVR